MRPEPHDCKTNFPFTHCANWLCTQAFSPLWQGELGVRDENWLLHGRERVRTGDPNKEVLKEKNELEVNGVLPVLF